MKKKSKKMEPIVVFGAGGHAKVVLDILELQKRYKIVAIIDTAGTKTRLQGYPVLKTLPSRIKRGIVAIGDNWRRWQVTAGILAEVPGFGFITAVHPNAVVARDVTVGAGTVVMAGACINTGTSIGEHCIVNTRASIDHDCVVDNFASVAPGATLGGEVKVGAFSAIGLGASCTHNIVVGEHAVVGLGAVVTRNIPSYVVAHGVPCETARKRKAGESYL